MAVCPSAAPLAHKGASTPTGLLPMERGSDVGELGPSRGRGEGCPEGSCYPRTSATVMVVGAVAPLATH